MYIHPLVAFLFLFFDIFLMLHISRLLFYLRYMRDQCDSESDWDVVLKAAQISIDLTNDTFQSFLEEIDERGWSRKKFMFGDMKRRSNWSQVVTSTSSHSLPTT